MRFCILTADDPSDAGLYECFARISILDIGHFILLGRIYDVRSNRLIMQRLNFAQRYRLEQMPLIRKLHPAPQFNNNEFIFSMLTHGVLLILIVVDCIDSDCVWWFHLSWKLACVWCVFFLLLVIDDLLPNRELQTNSNSKKKGTEILQI